MYFLFVLVYIPPAIHLARRKLLWEDEFFTLYLSKLSGWHELLRALATGADQHPPSFYYLTHAALGLLGTSHLTLRVPSIIGFGLLCICLYEIVRLLTTPLWGVVALLFPLGTNFYYYATEARAYALVSGFMALAVLAWMKATSQRRRGVWLALLGAGLAAAVGCHYYAVLPAACLGCGELVRTRVRRKLDLPVWLATACTLLPILAFAKTIRSARGYSTHFWAVPVWSDAVSFFQTEVAITLLAVCGFVALLLILQKNSLIWGSPQKVSLRPPWTIWQATTLTALALLPFSIMMLAKFVTHGFADRYAISAVIGVATLLAYTLYRLQPAPLVAWAAIAGCASMYVYQVHTYADTIEGARVKTASEVVRLAELDGQNVAVMESFLFHRFSFYAPRSVATRVAYLASPETSIKYLGHDTIDRGLLDLRPWFPLQVVPAGVFLRDNPRFYVFGAVTSWTWLPFDLPKWGDTQLLSRGKQGVLLFAVTNVRPDAAPLLADPGATDALFKRMPKDGPSLCKLWMGEKDCL